MTDPVHPARLTPRERRCMELVAAHYDTQGIADELGISVATVNGYLADARAKLGARNRKEAVRMLAALPPAVSEAQANDIGSSGFVVVGQADPYPSTVVRDPIVDRGQFDRVEDVSVSAAIPEPQPEMVATRGWLPRLLHFDRPVPPGAFGAGARLGMIVVLVVAMCGALALSVIAAVGLVSIYASLR